MESSNCNYENKENASFCASCGTLAEEHQNSGENGSNQQSFSSPVPVTNPVMETMHSLIKDELFLALCVTATISVGMSFLSLNFSVIGVLYAVFLWLFYSEGKKGNVEPKYIKYISGTAFAEYIMGWIGLGFVFLLGVLGTILFSVIAGYGGWESLLFDIRQFFADNGQFLPDNIEFTWLINLFASLSAVIFAAIIAVILIVGVFVLVFGVRSVHKFVQSLYKSIEQGQFNLVKINTVRIWLIVLGVLSGISAVFSITGLHVFSFLSEGSKAASYIIGSILIGKYFKS